MQSNMDNIILNRGQTDNTSDKWCVAGHGDPPMPDFDCDRGTALWWTKFIEWDTLRYFNQERRYYLHTDGKWREYCRPLETGYFLTKEDAVACMVAQGITEYRDFSLECSLA